MNHLVIDTTESELSNIIDTTESAKTPLSHVQKLLKTLLFFRENWTKFKQGWTKLSKAFEAKA